MSLWGAGDKDTCVHNSEARSTLDRLRMCPGKEKRNTRCIWLFVLSDKYVYWFNKKKSSICDCSKELSHPSWPQCSSHIKFNNAARKIVVTHLFRRDFGLRGYAPVYGFTRAERAQQRLAHRVIQVWFRTHGTAMCTIRTQYEKKERENRLKLLVFSWKL